MISRDQEQQQQQEYDFGPFLVSGKYADAILRIRVLESSYLDVPVHRLILSYQSSWFFDLFESPPMQLLHLPIWSVTISQDQETAIQVVLEWLYTGATSRLDADNCKEVWELAEQLRLPVLASACKEYNWIDPDATITQHRIHTQPAEIEIVSPTPVRSTSVAFISNQDLATRMQSHVGVLVPGVAVASGRMNANVVDESSLPPLMQNASSGNVSNATYARERWNSESGVVGGWNGEDRVAESDGDIAVGRDRETQRTIQPVSHLPKPPVFDLERMGKEKGKGRGVFPMENEEPGKRQRLATTDSGTLFIKKEFRIEVQNCISPPISTKEVVLDAAAASEEPTEVTPSLGPKTKTKKRGQNKAKDRAAPASDDHLLKLCYAVSSGEECTREKCKFSHNVEAYFAEKGQDLPGICPLFEAFGHCKMGLKCRFYKSHASIAYPGDPLDESKVILNIASRDFQKLVRSKKLDLGRAAHFERVWNSVHELRDKGGENEASGEHAKKLERIDLEGEGGADVKLRPQEKKRLDFRGKSYLAPLTTVGNLPFRRICKDFGVDITCAEMTMSQNLLTGIQSEWALLKRHFSEDFFGVQITGNHPVSFSQLCNIIEDNINVDFVDINLGCPVDAITNKGCGSALTERRAKLREMVIGASYVLSCPLTVKIRTGIKSKQPFAHQLVPLFQEWGASGITLHGRSKEQRYTKLADWEYIKECSALIDTTVENPPFFFGNGDIFNPEDYTSILHENPTIDGLMVGRGALIKPWIFKEIKSGQLWDITSSERLDILKKYANYGMCYWGSDNVGINLTRRFLCEWLSFLHRYVPVGLIEVLPQKINLRPERFMGRNELETLMASSKVGDWISITELVLGKAPDSFSFIPKHKTSSYE